MILGHMGHVCLQCLQWIHAFVQPSPALVSFQGHEINWFCTNGCGGRRPQRSWAELCIFVHWVLLCWGSPEMTHLGGGVVRQLRWLLSIQFPSEWKDIKIISNHIKSMFRHPSHHPPNPPVFKKDQKGPGSCHRSFVAAGCLLGDPLLLWTAAAGWSGETLWDIIRSLGSTLRWWQPQELFPWELIDGISFKGWRWANQQVPSGAPNRGKTWQKIGSRNGHSIFWVRVSNHHPVETNENIRFFNFLWGSIQITREGRAC